MDSITALVLIKESGLAIHLNLR